MSKKCRKNLRYESLDECLADVELLRAGVVEQCGAWSLAMMLDHLIKWTNGFLDGGVTRVPSVFQSIARWMIRRAVKTQKYPSFTIKAPKAFRPVDSPLESVYPQFKKMIERLRALPDVVATWPVGEISKNDFEQMMLLHAAHHLAYLRVK